MFRVADSQVASRWGNILEFQGFDLITPNEREARFALGDQDSRPAPRPALQRAAAGPHPEINFITPRPNPNPRFTVDPQDRVDAVGAGDALLSYATLSFVPRLPSSPHPAGWPPPGLRRTAQPIIPQTCESALHH
jgi:hypothetical protein